MQERISQISSEFLELRSEIQALLDPVPVDPVKWVEENRILKGQPFSFRDRPYLHSIYWDNSSRIVITKARQMEMTEFIVNWLLYNLTSLPHTIGIYTAPRFDQVSRFSRDRIRRALLDSPVLRRRMSQDKEDMGETAISRIPFSNGSLCYLLTAWGDFGAIRNIPSDFVAIDEAQDVQAEAIPVIEESMSHSQHRRMLVVGTASYTGDAFDKLWHESDMKEWDEESRAWIPHNEKNAFYSGYHLDQMMAPWIRNLPLGDPNSIESKRQRYSERRFLNEVRGLFYRGLAKPLLAEDLRCCLELGKPYALVSRLDPPYVSYMGVDWGGGEFSFTVVWIMARDTHDRWRVLYLHKFSERDPMKQVEKISNLIPLFNVKRAVADIGYGAVQVSELQKKFGDSVYGCQYVRRPETPLEVKTKDEHGQKISQLMVLADRSFWIETAIDIIKHRAPNGEVIPNLILPYQNPPEVEWVVDHFTCIEMEEQESISGKKYHHYTHPEGEPDDALHTFIYALIADAVGKMSPPLVVMDLL